MARRRHAPTPPSLRAFAPFAPSYLPALKSSLHPPAIFPVATLHPHPIRAKARPANESPAFTLV